ncbi:MAG: ABC transporter ATP-binding protein [Thiothrix sp.]|nr:MAG: ABC transporter ATP-binding protein [Thiothrix sp.]
MILIKDLSKSFGNNKVLNDINIEFEKGKVYGIIGENGSGKTTLFRCISGLESYRGLIESSYDSLKNNLGLLQTNPYCFKKITGREYLQFLSNARNINVNNYDEKNIFGLPLGRYVTTYSTGMVKKLAFIGILIQKNNVYILDEPFNGVDIQSNIIIAEVINRLKILGKTVIISSHIFSTLSEASDEIHLLDNGSFNKKYYKDDFKKLEEKMKENVLENKIEQFCLE